VGRLSERSFSNGVTTDYTYDSLSRINKLSHKKSSGSLIASFDYSYSDDGDMPTPKKTSVTDPDLADADPSDSRENDSL
jgi:hypothetical protein